jgi:hypothetical protein
MSPPIGACWRVAVMSTVSPFAGYSTILVV